MRVGFKRFIDGIIAMGMGGIAIMLGINVWNGSTELKTGALTMFGIIIMIGAILILAWPRPEESRS